jgi:hypothetical protein
MSMQWEPMATPSAPVVRDAAKIPTHKIDISPTAAAM